MIELTGTYGDALRFQFRDCGFEIYQMNAKRVKDASEVYDGVPSMHDAKLAIIRQCSLDAAKRNPGLKSSNP